MDKYDKILKIVHGFDYPDDMPLEQVAERVTERLTQLKEKGFGGIVTNVAFRDYTKSERLWEVLRVAVECCARLDMRVWLYDEDGYPSGGAGGLTLDANPDYECRGLVMLHAFVQPGESRTFEFPRGHEYAVAACSWKVCSTDLSGISAENVYREYRVNGKTEPLTVENDTDGMLFAAYFIKKHLYEGTHAEHNVCESRRYIDVTNYDAVREFIRNTYEQYTARLGDYFAGQNRRDGIIEAMFTDEPSFMGAYINAGLYPPSVHDEFDDTLPLYPVVNWGKNIENRILTEYGYDIKTRLIYLFAGSTKEARKTRLQFYTASSELYEQAFFRQLSDYCYAAGLPFSGHILLEDDIRLHPIFEGNFFSLLRHMHCPGIDMLQSLPEVVYDFAFTPKLISSIARAYGREHVMSEVSAHAQGGAVTPEQMLCSILLQYAFGVDVFTSYYGENILSAPEYARYNDALGRVEELMAGEDTRKIAVLYPIQTAQMSNVPVVEGIDSGIEKRRADACHDTLQEMITALIDAQIDFDFVDLDVLKSSEVGNGVIKTRFGAEYSLLILPACSVTSQIMTQFRRLKAAGVKLMYRESDVFLESAKRAFNYAVLYHRPLAAVASAKPLADPFVDLSNPCERIAMLCRDTQGGRRALLVNSEDKQREITAGVSSAHEPKVFFPLENETVSPCATPVSGGFIIKFTLPAYGSAIIYT